MKKMLPLNGWHKFQGVMHLKISGLQDIVMASRNSVAWSGYGLDCNELLDTLEKIKTPEKYGMKLDEVDRRIGRIVGQLEMMEVIPAELAETISRWGCS